MARSCALCGKTSMGGFNSQSSGMNKVRTHRRYSVNLHPYKIPQGEHARHGQGVHALRPHRPQDRLTRRAAPAAHAGKPHANLTAVLSTAVLSCPGSGGPVDRRPSARHGPPASRTAGPAYQSDLLA